MFMVTAKCFGRRLSFLGFVLLGDGTVPVTAIKVNMRVGDATVMKDFPDQQSAWAYIVEHPAPDVVIHPQAECRPPLPYAECLPRRRMNRPFRLAPSRQRPR